MENIFETDGKDRFDNLCHYLNIDNKKFEGLSKDEVTTLNQILEIKSEDEAMNSSSISESQFVRSKIYPMKESELNMYEESKSIH